MTEESLSLADMLEAKSMATEIVLLALLREKRGDVAFWASLEKLAQVVLSLEGLQDPSVQQRADKVQSFLDSWRGIAGDDPNQPSLSQSGPWTPPPR